MDLSSMAVFQAAERKMDWLSQRQKLVATNVANADTPEYMPSDMAPVKFKSHLLSKNGADVNLTQTNPKHLGARGGSLGARTTHPMHAKGTLPDATPFSSSEDKHPYDVSIDGNGVVLEEQMLKMQQTRESYEAVTTLFKKNMRMLDIAMSKGPN